MNIIYLLVNQTKSSGRRFYVGSKLECSVVKIDGIETIFCLRSNKPYYSSSQSLEFKQDLANGDIFSAQILEQVSDRKDVLKREDHWIHHYNAVESDEFYNITNAMLDCHDQDVIVNIYGETLKDLASRNSSLSKKDNTARALGYKNFGEMCLDIWVQLRTKSGQEISGGYGKQRHFARVFVKDYNEEQTLEDVKKEELIEPLRNLILNGCSLFLAAKTLNIEYPAARILLGDFNKTHEKAFTVAKLKGLSKEELEIIITKEILDGAGFREVAKKHGMVYESVKRYFLRCVRKRLKSSDL